MGADRPPNRGDVERAAVEFPLSTPFRAVVGVGDTWASDDRRRGYGSGMTDVPALLSHLHEMLGPDASFRPGQLEAIEAVARDRGRVLLVQRTGWGKSAVYFIATKLLREQGAGPDAARVSPAGADAQPDRDGRAHRRARRDDQLDEPRRVRADRRSAWPTTRSTCCWSRPSGSRTSASATRCSASSRARSACWWSTRRTASATGATTSVRTTGASCACSRRCPPTCPCSARPPPRTTA